MSESYMIFGGTHLCQHSMVEKFCEICQRDREIARLTASLKNAQRDTARGAIAIIEDFDHVSRSGGIITANDIIAAIKGRYQI